MSPSSASAGQTSVHDQACLVAALAGALSTSSGRRVRHLETHISHVLLTGDWAYKIKKAVDLGFVDFGTLDKRRRCCEEEIRLNRRLAPQIYVDVVAITGSAERPALGGSGPVLEYAVRMREFPQEALASRELERGALGVDVLDALAAEVASFHGRIERATPASGHGSPEAVLDVALQNFAQIGPRLEEPRDRDALAALHAWTLAEHALRREAFRRRQAQGFVRECHGDLHLGNIAIVDGAIVIFDCIEFNAELRWIDVASEVAFTVMDLADRGRYDLAHRFQNAYFELTGDYDGLAVFRFYLVYRALVRAKVACLRASQLPAGDAKAGLLAEYRGYVELARHYAQPPEPALVVTHGLSGTGKTTLTQELLELTGAIRVRTDVERKRLHGLSAQERSGSAVAAGLYSEEATVRTYRRALTLAEAVAAAGRVAIVDGAFLQRRERDLFRRRAAELGLPFAIVAFAAPEVALRARIAARAARGTDASEADLAVLDHQLRTQQPLAPDEDACAIRVDAAMPLDAARDPGAWRAVLAWLGATGTLRR